MSPTLYSCVICGYLIDGYASPLWLKEFRAGILLQHLLPKHNLCCSLVQS